jgi:tRNA1Val (adenine37-N6)-methyltransferase
VQEFDDEQFDFIISNPPYFVDSLLCPDSQRTTARHTTDLTFEDLDKAVCRLLNKGGRFALILPVEQMERYISMTQLHLVRRCDVYPVVGGQVKRVMAEFAFENRADVVVENLAIERGQRGDYTEQYMALTKDFYLKF